MIHRLRRTRHFRDPWRHWVVPAFGSLLVGCGNLTAGGATGEAEVRMSGNSGGAAPVGNIAERGSAPLGAVVVLDLEGVIEVAVQVFLQSADGDELQLTSAGEVRVEADLGGVQEPTVTTLVVPAGLYSGLRVVFGEVVADVAGGLIIDGIPYFGPVTVDIAIAGLVVTRTLDIEVMGDERTVLLLDLNADAWLPALEILTQTVDAQVFADQVAISVR